MLSLNLAELSEGKKTTWFTWKQTITHEVLPPLNKLFSSQRGQISADPCTWCSRVKSVSAVWQRQQQSAALWGKTAAPGGLMSRSNKGENNNSKWKQYEGLKITAAVCTTSGRLSRGSAVVYKRRYWLFYIRLHVQLQKFARSCVQQLPVLVVAWEVLWRRKKRRHPTELRDQEVHRSPGSVNTRRLSCGALWLRVFGGNSGGKTLWEICFDHFFRKIQKYKKKKRKKKEEKAMWQTGSEVFDF